MIIVLNAPLYGDYYSFLNPTKICWYSQMEVEGLEASKQQTDHYSAARSDSDPQIIAFDEQGSSLQQLMLE